VSILVVDDQRSTRVLLGGILEQAGYTVHLAENGAQALAAYVRERPRLVLLDFVMPGLNGPAVTRAIRARAGGGDVPIILLTSSDREQDIGAAFEAGATDYLTKPVDRRLLLERVQAILGRLP
jgi:twitching motility two-component system response regulator PilH